jgi:hypothetical protein
MTSTTTAAEAMADSRTVVSVTFGDPPSVNRLWGIPIVGYLVRWIALLPHAIVLWFASIVLGLSFLVVWVPVLLFGRQPLAGFYLWFFRYTTRMLAWGFFLSNKYPPLINDDGTYPVQVSMPVDAPINRLWGILWFGIMLRYILLIPHLFVLFAFTFITYFIWLILWIPILINGRVPTALAAIMGGLIRQQIRVFSWLYLCPISYPPFLP